MGSIMNVTLVPFGNSKFNGTELECQHGEDECTANSWEQCAITLYPKFSTHWPFYLCVETAAKVRVARALDQHPPLYSRACPCMCGAGVRRGRRALRAPEDRGLRHRCRPGLQHALRLCG